MRQDQENHPVRRATSSNDLNTMTPELPRGNFTGGEKKSRSLPHVRRRGLCRQIPHRVVQRHHRRRLLPQTAQRHRAVFHFLAPDGETELDSSLDTDGFRLGAGVEQAIGEQGFVKLEYRYSNYSEAEIDFEDPAINDGNRVDIDLDRHQVVAGFGVRF